MKKISLLILTLGMGITLSAQTKNHFDQPYVQVTGNADTSVAPDEIFLDIIIQELDTKGKVSVEEQENKMVEALEKLGIDTQTQLVLKDASSNFKSFLLKSQDIFKRKSFQLEVSSAKTAGEVLLALENLDISNVRVARTSYSKMDQLNIALKSEASLDAQRNARALTEPLGQKVGAPLLITENSLPTPLYSRLAGVQTSARGYRKKEQAYEPADIEFEKIQVNTSVSIIFKIDD